ncbi:MBL fold metallo-hydrolase [Paenibacillus sp. J31TS4]|uniref:MBL fold metallo-hydrolase n=1 Tax=Paenibacillus sp. J31TS4 TaxID=2807195 RepID=UPI001B1A55B6|nr:MBL fold metallo-hydrolase [Paenibacillus sp. J31TS4]GIP37234.1 MBL fold metallo-hydrolase [Paenibacillus sp. J31TS4]
MKSYKEGDALWSEITGTKVSEDSLFFWSLGQEGYAYRTPNSPLIMVDPYLSNWVYELIGDPWTRSYPPVVDPAKLQGTDYVLLTHHHEDHMDRLTLTAMAEHTGAKFITPKAHVGLMESWGIPGDRLIPATHQEPIRLDCVEIVPYAAMHEQLETDTEGNHLYLSYLLRADGIVWFHGGDTIGFPEQEEWLKPETVDVAFLPINGRDYARNRQGIAGNMNYREAVDLAIAIEADLLVPMHIGMFPHNEENPAFLLDYLYRQETRLKHHILLPGELFVYRKSR